MRAIKYRELRRMYEMLGPEKTVQHLREAITREDAPLRPDDFSIRDLAEAFIGVEVVRSWRDGGGFNVLEAESAVDSTAFSNITGLIIQQRVLEAYQMEVGIAPGLMSFERTRIKNERLAGLTRTGDVTGTVHEGKPYPHFGFGERYQDYPVAVKRGHIVSVTKEAVFFDTTGQILQRAGEVGTWLGVDKEKRCWRVILGITNNYNVGGVAWNTYCRGTNTTPDGAWLNVHDNPLQTWRDIDTAEGLWDNMTDPSTNEPIIIGGTKILVMPSRYATAQYILNATEVSQNMGGVGLVVPAGVTMTSRNPASAYTLAPMSRTARAQVAAAAAGTVPTEIMNELWIMGDFARAFVYREHWPITVTQAPANSEADFNQDIVARYKASEYGVAAVKDPRWVVASFGQCDYSSSGTPECVPEDDWPMITETWPLCKAAAQQCD